MVFVAVVVLIVLALVMTVKAARVLSSHQAGLVMRLGRHHATVGPGLVWMAPLIDSLIVVDLREQRVATEERLLPESGSAALAHATVAYRVIDPVQATLGVSNLVGAITERTNQHLREEAARGRLRSSADETRAGERLQDKLANEARAWGTEITSVQVNVTAASPG